MPLPHSVSHAVCASFAAVPSGQARQVAEPSVDAYVLSVHGVQLPPASLAVPAGQISHPVCHSFACSPASHAPQLADEGPLTVHSGHVVQASPASL